MLITDLVTLIPNHSSYLAQEVVVLQFFSYMHVLQILE